MTQTVNPFAQTTNPTDTEDMFADPEAKSSEDFVTVDDLDGRLICVYPKECRREKSTKSDGKDYDKIVADVIVLDGPVTEKIGSVPLFVPDMHFNAWAVTSRIKGNVGTGKPVLGRIDSRPSKVDRRIPAYGIQPATAQEKVAAAPIVRSVIAAQDFAN